MTNLLIAQTDTRFWFAAPDISSQSSLDQPIEITIVSYANTSNVVISMPAGGGMPTQTLSLAPFSTQTINLTTWLSNIETPANTIQDRGILVESDNDISAYYTVRSSSFLNPELFALKGNNALGTSFIIPGQTSIVNEAAYSPEPRAAFVIVATEDNTSISISQTDPLVGWGSLPYMITLDRGQTYAATAQNTTAGEHLDGSVILSNKPIAITVSDDLIGDNTAYGICRDLGGDQIVPINLLGTKHIAINGELTNANNNAQASRAYITATQNGTTIYINGTLVATINASQTFEALLGTATNTASYIETSNPAMVWQLSGIGCEMGLTQLPQLDCTGSRDVSYTRLSSSTLWFNVIIKSGHQANFLINGSNTLIPASAFNPVPGTSGNWVFAKLDLSTFSPPGGVIRITNSSSNFHLGVLDGATSGGASYGYFSDYGTNVAIASALNNPFCPGDNVQLQANTVAGASYVWTGPNSFYSTLQNPIIYGANSLNVGTYTLTVTTPDSCTGTDNIDLWIACDTIDSCDIQLKVCVDADLPLTYEFNAVGIAPGGTYDWDFGDGTPILSTTSGNVTHTYSGSGYYNVVVTYTTPSGTTCEKQYNICIGDVPYDPADGEAIGDVFPNPANTQINIPINKMYLTDETTNNIDCFIYSTDGKVLLSQENNKIGEGGIISLPITELNTGLYIIRVTINGQTEQKKFVKM